MCERWLRVIKDQLDAVPGKPGCYRSRGDFSIDILTTSSGYERHKPDEVLYAPKLAFCARYDEDRKSLIVDTSDKDFLLVFQELHRPGYDGPDYKHYIPWEHVSSIIVGRHG
jgi:hypothetical protein